MKRKVIQLSVSTLVVSLPNEWTEKHTVKKGSEVEVREKGNDLVISKEKEESKIILETKGKVFDKRYLADLYIRGYDEIRINYDDSKVLEEIKRMMVLPTLELVEETANYCVIKDISNVKEGEFDTMLRKCFLLAKEMSNGLVEYFKGSGVDLVELRKLEEENTKASVFCLRILNKHGYVPAYKTTFLYVISRELEAICDIYKYIIDDVLAGYEVREEEKEYFSSVHDFFTKFYELFYKYDKDKFKEFYLQRKELIQKGRGLVKEKGSLAHHTLNIVVALYNICGPYLTMNIEEIYKK